MQQLRIIFGILLIFYLTESIWSQAIYCNPNLCRNGRRHIGCNNNGSFGRACSINARIIPIPETLQRRIVRLHNSLRNRIARGNNRYQPAIRMATMVWNPELARLAALHVRRCPTRHDQCRNTPTFLFSGQNSGRTAWRGFRPSEGFIIIRMLNSWFRTNRLCTSQQISSLTDGIVRRCGQFTSIIQEKNNAVGCAILSERRNGRRFQFLTCNYAYSNVRNRPAYRVGTAAANCTTGTNPQFQALCSIRETYRLRSTQW